jgi:hypothetical protein
MTLIAPSVVFIYCREDAATPGIDRYGAATLLCAA